MSQGSFNNFWFPEELTPWFYLASYHQLPILVRQRYNQLYALITNEVFAIFESDFITQILLKKIDSVDLDPDLKRVMQYFCEEEIKHARMFNQLNKIAEPKLYLKSSISLSKTSNPMGFLALLLIKKWPDFFGAWIWISFFLEERSLVYSKYYMQAHNNHLNSAFRQVHHLHLLEENYHVQLDEVIIDSFYKPLSWGRRRLAAWMLERFVQTFKQPKKFSLRAAKILKTEFPLQAGEIDQCLHELEGLKNNHQFHQVTLFGEATLRFRKMLSQFPEMKRVLSLLSRKV